MLFNLCIVRIRKFQLHSLNLKLIILLVGLISFLPLQAQKWNKIMKGLTDPAKVEKSRGTIEKALLENPDNVMANYCLSVICENVGDNISLYRAWIAADNANTAFQENNTVPPKTDINKYFVDAAKSLDMQANTVDSLLWFKGSGSLGLAELRYRLLYLDNSHFLEQYRNLMMHLDYKQTLATNTSDAFDRFLALYPDAIEASDIIVRRDQLEFETVKQKDLVFVYNEFIARHPKSLVIEQAIKIRDQKSFELVANTNDLADLDFFIANYPTASQVEMALKARYKLAFDQAVKNNTIEGYQHFIAHNPLTPYIPDATARRDALVFEQLQLFANCGAYQLFMSGLPFADKAFKAFLQEYSNRNK